MIPNAARALLPRRRAFASGAPTFVFFGANRVGSFTSFGISFIVNSFYSKIRLSIGVFSSSVNKLGNVHGI